MLSGSLPPNPPNKKVKESTDYTSCKLWFK